MGFKGSELQIPPGAGKPLARPNYLKQISGSPQEVPLFCFHGMPTKTGSPANRDKQPGIFLSAWWGFFGLDLSPPPLVEDPERFYRSGVPLHQWGPSFSFP